MKYAMLTKQSLSQPEKAFRSLLFLRWMTLRIHKH